MTDSSLCLLTNPNPDLPTQFNVEELNLTQFLSPVHWYSRVMSSHGMYQLFLYCSVRVSDALTRWWPLPREVSLFFRIARPFPVAVTVASGFFLVAFTSLLYPPPGIARAGLGLVQLYYRPPVLFWEMEIAALLVVMAHLSTV